jgi:ATP-binding cassette subfamily C protein
MSNKLSDSAALGSLTRLLRDLARDAGARGLEAGAFIVLGSLVEGIGLLLLIPFLSLIIDIHAAPTAVQGATESLLHTISANTRTEKLVVLVAVFVALLVFRAFVIVRRDTLIVRLQQGFMERVRSRISHRLATADWALTSRLRHSRIAHVISFDVHQVSSATYLLWHESASVILLISQIGIAVYLSPAMAALAAIAVGLGALTILPMLERARRFGAYVTRSNQTLTEDTGQFLGALKLAVSQNLQDGFTSEFDASLANLTAEQVDYVRRQTLLRQIVTTASSLLGAGAMIVGVAIFNVPASVLIALLLIFTRINSPTAQLYFDLQHLAQTLPSYEKITALEAELAPSTVQSTYGQAERAALLSEPIAFRNVTFLHSDPEKGSDHGGVRSLTLSLLPGSVTGVAGPSGAGKTTFVDLLVGLFQPQSGTIAIGPSELKGATITAWRGQVGYVAQDPFLFHDTIRRNLLWASPQRSEAELWSALELAGIAEFVRKTPLGLDTIVGERGTLISGGERQRIGLARAVLRKPQLLVLDEATNAIDVENERLVMQRLVGLVPRPTLVIVAHRPESLSLCERILQFENGRIVADDARPVQQAIARASSSG